MTELEQDVNIDQNMELIKIRKEILQRFKDYQRVIQYMAGDAPLGVLCLPKAVETILGDNGFLRVYDLFDRDFTEIKGLGAVRCRDLTTRLHEFLSML